MTWFSSILINPQKREGRRLLGNRQLMHKAVLQSFPPDFSNVENRVLWRLDSEKLRHTLYVVSPSEPDFTHLNEQAGWVSQTWNTADYDGFLTRLKLGQKWGFRLQANPVKRKSNVTLPHVTVEQQIKWLADNSKKYGFALQHVNDSQDNLLTQVTHREDLRFHRRDPHQNGAKKVVTIRKVQFDGVLEVTDTKLLQQALTQGIGRAKAYGLGLMTLRQIKA